MMGELIDREKEISEAIHAGERALSSLQRAKKYLSSAGNWGILDLFGGGALTGLIKHSKLSDSQRCLDMARQDLRSFQRELDDVDEFLPDVDIGGFLTFADFFFDGFLADVLVQSKIRDAKKQVDDAIYQVESIVSRLRYEIS